MLRGGITFTEKGCECEKNGGRSQEARKREKTRGEGKLSQEWKHKIKIKEVRNRKKGV